MRNKLQLALFGAVLFLLLAIGVRAYLANRTDQKLCHVIYTLVARSGATVGKPGSPGYAYYQQHPDELKKARQQNQDFLGQLPCK